MFKPARVSDEMANLVDDVVGACGEVVFEQSEELAYLPLVDVAQAIYEVSAHQQDILCDVFHVLLVSLWSCLLCAQKFYEKVCAHEVDSFFEVFLAGHRFSLVNC